MPKDTSKGTKPPDLSAEDVDLFGKLSAELEEFGTAEPSDSPGGNKQEARAIVVTKLT